MTVPQTVEAFIDWSRRTVRVLDPDGPSVAPRDSVETLGGLWAIVPRFPGEILTADKYNADRQVMVDNAVPPMIDDYSETLAQMQAATDPYPGGAPSLATSLAGELERIRYVLKSLNPTGQWYEVPTLGLNPAVGLRLDNAEPLYGQRTDGSYGALIMMNSDNQVYVGSGLVAGSLVLGTATSNVYAPGYVTMAGGATIQNNLILQKNRWLHWDDVYAIVVDAGNYVLIGGNAVGITLEKYTTFPVGASITGLTVNGALEANGAVHIDTDLTVDGVVSFTGTSDLQLTKGKWLAWDGVRGITVGTDNILYLAGTAAQVTILKNTQITGLLVVTGDATVAGTVTSISAVRAWARVDGITDTYAGQHGFTSVSHVSVGNYRFVLAQAYPNGYSVTATVEGQSNVTPVVYIEAVDRFVVVLTGPAAAPVNGFFHVMVAGQG
jgi:hypothetical protein